MSASWRATLLVVTATILSSSSALSQGQQDALVRTVFDIIGTTNQFFVEVGFDAASFEDGTGANTWQLYLDGWRGVLIDSGHENASIGLHRAHVSSGNVAQLFRDLGVPDEPDYVSLDVDTTDVWILERVLETYRPRVVTVEYNSNFGDGNRSALAFPDE